MNSSQLAVFAGVITGDIVGSRKLSSADFEQVIISLERLLKSFKAKYSIEFDIYRGDSFQIKSAPALSARIATIIDLSLRSGSVPVEARQCIGIGAVTPGSVGVKTASGEAYLLSGQGVDRIKGRGVSVCTANPDFQAAMVLLTRFFDSHLARLTTTQAQVVKTYLLADNKSHDHLAFILDKKRSNVTRILNTSQYHLITGYLEHYAAQVKKDFTL